MTSQSVIDALIRRYPDPWARFQECPQGTGAHASRFIDFYAMHPWPSKAYQTVAVEVKVSKGDWRRELNQPQKRAPWERLATETYFAAPYGVIPVEEVPEGWGLLEMTQTGKLQRTRAAPQRRIDPLPMPFVAALVKRSGDKTPDEVTFDLNGRPVRLADLEGLAHKLYARSRRRRRGEDLEAQRRRSSELARLGSIAHAACRLTGQRIHSGDELVAWWQEQGGAVPLTSRDRRQLEAARHVLEELLDAEAESA